MTCLQQAQALFYLQTGLLDDRPERAHRQLPVERHDHYSAIGSAELQVAAPLARLLEAAFVRAATT